jgi:hypothetical protein
MKSKKLSFAMDYLTTHPAAMQYTGRALALLIATPHGKLTYRTWNTAKQRVEAAYADERQYARVEVNHIEQTVTDPRGVITALRKLKALTPETIEAFYHAAGYSVTERSEKRLCMVKRLAVSAADKAAA